MLTDSFAGIAQTIYCHLGTSAARIRGCNGNELIATGTRHARITDEAVFSKCSYQILIAFGRGNEIWSTGNQAPIGKRHIRLTILYQNSPCRGNVRPYQGAHGLVLKSRSLGPTGRQASTAAWGLVEPFKLGHAGRRQSPASDRAANNTCRPDARRHVPI